MTCPPLLYLSADDIRTALPMSKAIEAMRDAFAQLANEQVTLPVRECMRASGQDGVNLVMPCHSAAAQMFSLKTVTVFGDNPQRGLPRIQGLIVLTDGETGSHVAVMDGTSLTAIRTGAVSGLATDLMAPPDASLVAIFGAGVQARTQLEAVCAARAIEQAKVYDPDQGAAERLAAEMTSYLQVPVARAETTAENLADVQVVCTATSSPSPVFTDQDLPPKVHINAVGAYTPETVEIPAETVCRSYVVVDQVAAALKEAGDLLQPLKQNLIEPSHFHIELGDVVTGQSPARKHAGDITLFKSVGVAIQDLCAGTRAWENARQMGLGIALQ